MKITEVHIKSFRSIYDAKIKLADLNIISGLNDSGKSNLLKALNLFFNGETGWKESFNFGADFSLSRNKEDLKKRKKAPIIEITVYFDNVYGQSPVWKKVWRDTGLPSSKQWDKKATKFDREGPTGFKPKSGVPGMLRNVQYLYIPAIKGSDYLSHLVGRLSEILGDDGAGEIRGAATGFEDKLSKYFDDITKDIAETLSISSLLKLPNDLTQIFENMEFTNTQGVSLANRGDGLRTRHIPILLSRISSLKETLRKRRKVHSHFIWGYEEPENNVELSACFDMAQKFYDEYSKDHQILISTHSPAFYGLPEKNNPDWSQGEDRAYRYYADMDEEGKTSYVERAEEHFDKNFLLPAATKLLVGQKKENEELLKEVKRLKPNSFFGKPTIIVEGITDKIIIKKAIEIFFPNCLNKINIKAPNNKESGGGARFVRNHLLIWDGWYLHNKGEHPHKACGIFDDDDAGYKEKKDFDNKKSKNNNFALAIKYDTDFYGTHFEKLKGSHARVELPKILENLYSPALWQFAKRKGWLENRLNQSELLPRDVQYKVSNSPENVTDLCGSDDLAIYVTHEFFYENKKKMANHIATLDKEEARECLSLFKKTVSRALISIGVLEEGAGDNTEMTLEV